MQKRAILIIFLTVFIDLVGFGIIIPLTPFLVTSFGADAFMVGLLMGIYSLAQFLFAPLWGQLSDRLGRRPIILVSLLGAGLSHLMFAFADHLWVLFVARALAGLFGANISTAMAYIADITEKKDRSKSMGLIGAAFGLGFVLGPFLGGIFAQFGDSLGDVAPFGKSFAAVGAAIICLLNFGMAIFLLKESLPQSLRSQVKKRPPRFKNITKHFSTPVVGSLMTIFFLGTVGMASMEASLFLFVKDQFNWDMVTASYGFAYVGVIMVLTQGLFIRKLMPLWGERKVLLIGLFLFAIGIGGIGWAEHVWYLGIVVTLLALGSGFMNPAINGSISLLTSNEEQGSVMGVNQSLSAMARIFGPAIGGWLYVHAGHSSPFWLSGAFGAIAFGIAVLHRNSLPEAGKQS
ncbi:MAG: MFS transporter [Pseudobdellovibrionaceae bacterium]|nr:MAG: MFS transporter [Pseudobdellovibrionaceae bacterium]